MPPAASNSGIKDNHSRGSVGDFLRQHLKPGADLDLVTAYFAVFAFDKLRTELNHLGKKEPYEALYRQFDRRTEQGSDMQMYSCLLTNVVESAAGTFQTRLASGLQNSRSFVLPVAEAQPQPNSDFELVTWLIVMAPDSASR